MNVPTRQSVWAAWLLGGGITPDTSKKIAAIAQRVFQAR